MKRIQAKHRRARRIQFTIRDVPIDVDRAIRHRARASGTSLNQALIDALRAALRLERTTKPGGNLRRLAGRWVEDPAFDEAQQDFGKIDEGLWR